MCGLFGIINREKTIASGDKLIKLFKQGLFCDTLRGGHGTGIHAVNDKGVERTYKRALAAPDFLELSTAKKIIEDNKNIILMGHNRYATFGEHTDEATHPYTHHDTTLFHNGTLKSHNQLNPGKTFDVDSDAIAYLISVSSDRIEALESLKGAYALAWYDGDDQAISFARNSERPLFLATLKGTNSVIYSSEKGLIKWLAGRNEIELESVEALPVGKLVTIPLNPSEKVRTQEFKPHIATYENYYNYGNYSKTVVKHTAPDPIPSLKTGFRIIAKGIEWCSYNNQTDHAVTAYGYIKFEWKPGIFFHIAGQQKTEGNKYIDKIVELEVTAITSETLGYARVIGIVQDNIVVGQVLPKKTAIISKEGKEGVKEIASIDLNKEEEDIIYTMVLGPRGRYVTPNDYLRRVSGGCSNCGDLLTLEDAPTVKWEYENQPFCKTCAEYYNMV